MTRFTTSWAVRWSNCFGCVIPACVQTDSGSHPASCKIWIKGLFPRVKAAGAWRSTPPSIAEVKDRVELYLYSPSWPIYPYLYLYNLASSFVADHSDSNCRLCVTIGCCVYTRARCASRHCQSVLRMCSQVSLRDSQRIMTLLAVFF